MDIKKFREHIYTTYGNLKEGAVFKIEYGSINIFMKINDAQGVCLNDPDICWFEKNDRVREIQAVHQLMEV